MTKLEMQAIALANEVENALTYGTPIVPAVVLALNEFRKVQTETDARIGADLDAMYKTYLNTVGALDSESAQNIKLFMKKV